MVEARNKNKFETGPGSYEISNKFLKREPTATIGNSIRSMASVSKFGPDPTTYSNGGDIA